MRRARGAVGLGLVLLIAGFCFGVDTPISVTVAGQTVQCADVIPAGMLVSGQSDSSAGMSADLRTPAERRFDASISAACGPLVEHAGVLVWSALGLGAVSLLAGWTVLREQEGGRPRREGLTTGTPVHT